MLLIFYQLLIVLIDLLCCRIKNRFLTLQEAQRICENLIDALIEIMKSEHPQLSKARCAVSARFNIVCNKNDLFETGHLRLSGCMAGDSRQNLCIFYAVAFFCQISAEFCVEQRRILSLTVSDLQMKFFCALQFLLIGAILGAVMKQTSDLCAVQVLSLTHRQTNTSGADP